MENKLFATLANPFGIFIFAVISLSLIYQAGLRLLSSQYILFVTNLIGGLAFIIMMLLLGRTYKKMDKKTCSKL